MRKAMPFLAVMGFAALALQPSWRLDQETSWGDLNNQAYSLYAQGEYLQAAILAQEALKVGDKTFSDDSGIQNMKNLIPLQLQFSNLY